jgi:Ran GTPase-activating protein (RanGAP) involved in mRNA processing and transport
LGIKGSIDLLEALAGNMTVKELLINGNGFGDKSIPSLINFLKNPDNVLEVLGIAHNDISSQGIKALAPTLGIHQHLRELNLDGNPIHSNGVQSLLSLIWKGGMKSLSLSHCEISSCDWANSLVYMTNLESLSLSYNRIDGMSLQGLCESLQRCACLRHLNLSYNNLQTIQAGCVGQLMKIHKGLISLNLAGNELPNEVIAAIVLGIYGNCTLRTLNLAWCHLTAHHASLLCHALADNNLLDLNIDFNPVPDDMRTNPRMSSVYLARRQVVESNRHTLETDGLNRLDSNTLVAAILRSSTATTSSSGAVAEEEEHLEFAFVDELSAETASELWRQQRLSQIMHAEQAFDDVSTLQGHGIETLDERGAEDSVLSQQIEQDNELKLHIDPGGVAEKAKKHLISSQSALIDVHDGKFVLSISYGRRNEIIGSIEVSERMTYSETRALIRPLLESYFEASEKKYLEKAYNFKLLDGLGFVLTEEAEKVSPSPFSHSHTRR